MGVEILLMCCNIATMLQECYVWPRCNMSRKTSQHFYNSYKRDIYATLWESFSILVEISWCDIYTTVKNIRKIVLHYRNSASMCRSVQKKLDCDIFATSLRLEKKIYKYSYFFIDTTRVLCYIGCQQKGTNNMIMIITVEIKTEYGQERIYPVCDEAKSFAKIAGTKTLTRETCKLIKQLGYTFDVYKRFNF